MSICPVLHHSRRINCCIDLFPPLRYPHMRLGNVGVFAVGWGRKFVSFPLTLKDAVSRAFQGTPLAWRVVLSSFCIRYMVRYGTIFGQQSRSRSRKWCCRSWSTCRNSLVLNNRATRKTRTNHCGSCRVTPKIGTKHQKLNI